MKINDKKIDNYLNEAGVTLKQLCKILNRVNPSAYVGISSPAGGAV